MDNIERTIRRMSDDELVQMTGPDREDYTDDALYIARDELRVRNIPYSGQEPVADARAAAAAPVAAASEPPERARKRKEIDGLSLNRGKLIEALLTDELQYLESGNAILDFVTSMNIRNGEYEGTVTVIKKMDFDNFILFAEGTNAEGGRSIAGCVAVGKEELEEKIKEIGKRNGWIGREAY